MFKYKRDHASREQTSENAKRLQAFEPCTARVQGRPQIWQPKLRRGAFCAFVRADSESADETGRRARRRHLSGG
eukprot:15464350-Alexandrium_andersonii.AAC.1